MTQGMPAAWSSWATLPPGVSTVLMFPESQVASVTTVGGYFALPLESQAPSAIASRWPSTTSPFDWSVSLDKTMP